MNSYNFQTPPPLPEDQNEETKSVEYPHSDTDSFILNGHPASLHPNRSRDTRQNRRDRFTPGRFACVIGALIAGGVVSSLFFPVSWGASTQYTPEIMTSAPALANPVSVEMQTPFITDSNDLIVNYKLTKSDPYARADLSLSAEAVSAMDESYAYLGLAQYGFGLEEAWVSAVFEDYSLPSAGIEGIDIFTDTDTTYTETIDDYSYLAYDASKATAKDLLQEYQRQYPMSQASIKLLTDGAESQSGIVTFEVSLPKSGDSISGQVNIVYKKDGQVVFGALYDVYSTSQSRKSFAYTPEIQVPEYDEVEIINMYGNSSADSSAQAGTADPVDEAIEQEALASQ